MNQVSSKNPNLSQPLATAFPYSQYEQRWTKKKNHNWIQEDKHFPTVCQTHGNIHEKYSLIISTSKRTTNP